MTRKIIYLLIIITGLYYCYAQNIEKSINIGISEPTGSNSPYWELRPSLSGHLFYSDSGKFMFGGHIGIHRWISKPDRLKEKYNNNLEGINIDSYGLVFEFIPSVRYILDKSKDAYFFTQGGFGFFTRKFETEKIFINSLGVNLGGGFVLTIFNKINPEVTVLYNIILGEDERFQYFSLNTGVNF